MNITLSTRQGEPDMLYQWDTDRQIEIDAEGLALDEVHFSNVYLKEALVIKPKGTTVDIPNILLQYETPIHIYTVTYSENGERVTGKKVLNVTGRTKPSDYVYTPTEVKRYEALEERIHELEENGGVADLSKYLKKEELDTAIDSALTQAKESGSFNGKDGEKGDKGDKGEPGIPGEKGEPGADGKDGTNGKDGTSVTVTKVSESEIDGGNNVVTFSDGTSLTVRNGKTGAKGDPGAKGEQGVQGEQGDTGKSAYAYAKDSAYSGSEAEFSKMLAETLDRNAVTELINTQLGVVEDGTY